MFVELTRAPTGAISELSVLWHKRKFLSIGSLNKIILGLLHSQRMPKVQWLLLPVLTSLERVFGEPRPGDLVRFDALKTSVLRIRLVSLRQAGFLRFPLLRLAALFRVNG